MKKIIPLIIIVVIVVLVVVFILNKNDNVVEEKYYLSNSDKEVTLLDLNKSKVKEVPRGTQVSKIKEEDNYIKIKYDNNEYLVLKDNITNDYQKVVTEKKVYIRTQTTLYEKHNDIKILSTVKKGSEVEVVGYDKLNKDGTVNMYQVKYQKLTGYIYSKYTVYKKEEALLNYNKNKIYNIHKQRTDTLGGGSGKNLDYYPYPKGNFKNNKMPDEVRALYINSGSITDIDKYIKIAKESNINAFVVDIKDNTAPSYKSNVMKKLSKTSYDEANLTMKEYKKYIDKIKDDFYIIGRITVFKDSYYIKDNPKEAIIDSKLKKAYNHNGSYWPTAYSRKVWEYNVRLALEAVKEFGFNEIQFDYVRFPDNTYGLEKSGKIDMKNTYKEDKAVAIQNFLMYATDELHKQNTYVSADVFGESAHTYVTGYGQYFASISNVVDVISPMPYPDHFNIYEYGFTKPVWTVPYNLLKFWGTNYVSKRQQEIPTPAKVRTWIQVYDAIRDPYIEYDTNKIKEQIKGLKDSGLNGGYMTWNGASSLTKYNEVKKAF